MSQQNNPTTLKGFWYTALDQKAVTQKIYKTIMSGNRLSLIFSKTDALNGIKEYVITGLKKYKNYDRETKIEQYNPTSPLVDNFYILADNKWIYSVEVPITFSLMTGFVSFNQKQAFIKDVILNNATSLAKDLEVYRFQTLMTQKIIATDGNVVKRTNDSPAGRSFYIDDDFNGNAGSDNPKLTSWFKNDKASKEDIIAGLEIIKKHMKNYETLDFHTKFARDNKAGNFMSSYKPSDFFIIWNTKYEAAISTARASVYNDLQLTLKGSTQIYLNFNSEALTAGMGNDDIKLAEKTICYIVHKDALKEITPSEALPASNMIPTPNMKTIHSTLYIFGLARLKYFPITRFVEQ